MTFIVEDTLQLLLQQYSCNNLYSYNNHCIKIDHYYTVIITTKLWITTFYHFPSEDEVLIGSDGHYRNHYYSVMVTTSIMIIKKGKIKCIDLHYYVLVNITTIHFHYQVVTILSSNVHFNCSDIHYSVFTVHR